MTVVSRVDCHLCDVAKEVVARVAQDTGVTWTEVDVDADPALLAEYSDLVPVILVDGRVHGYWRVSEERLRQALAAAPGTPPWLEGDRNTASGRVACTEERRERWR